MGTIDVALARALDRQLETPTLGRTAEVSFGTTRWGEEYAVLTGHRGGPYVRMDRNAGEIALRLDGTRTVGEAAAAAGVDRREAEAIVAVLRRDGVLEDRAVDVRQALVDRLVSPAHRLGRRAGQVLRSQTVSTSRVDGVVGRIHGRVGRLLFSLPAAVVAIGVALGGAAAYAASVQRDGLDLTAPLSGASAAVLLAALLVAISLHELGHALVLKHAGRRVNGAGVQLYFGHPAVFVDSSDVVFATRGQRAANAAAGLCVELVLAGAASVLVWRSDGTVGEVALRFSSITYINVLVNLVPFIELDGYWLLTDLLDLPGLRGRSLAVLRRDVPARIRHQRGRLTRREWLLLAFGAAGVICSVAALVVAWIVWWPLMTSLASPLWHAGWPGVLTVGVVALVAVAPVLVTTRGVLARSWRWVRVGLADLRFRRQRGWRVEAAALIAARYGAVDDDTLADLAGRVERRRVSPGDVVVAAGDGGHDWHLVRSGELDLLDGTGRALRTLQRGDSFGEQPLLDRGPSQASVRARAASQLFTLDAGAYLRSLADVEEGRVA